MSRYEDPEIQKFMRESDERFEQILRETRALRLGAEGFRTPRDSHEQWEKAREQRRAELREFKARLKRFEEGTGGASR